jgi:hypothetical protein
VSISTLIALLAFTLIEVITKSGFVEVISSSQLLLSMSKTTLITGLITCSLGELLTQFGFLQIWLGFHFSLVVCEVAGITLETAA